MAGESCSYCEREIGLDVISAYLLALFHPWQTNTRSYLSAGDSSCQDYTKPIGMAYKIKTRE